MVIRLFLVNEKIPFPEYPNFRIYNIAYSDTDDERDAITTNYRAIVHNNRLISIVRERKAYSVIPHELIYETAVNITKEKNLILVDRFTTYSRKDKKFVITLLDPRHTFEFDGDKYTLGITISNSYDYSMSLTASLYLHRETYVDGEVRTSGLFMPIDLFKLRHIGNVYSLINRYEDIMNQVFDKKDIVIKFLQDMKNMKLTPRLVFRLKDFIPLRVLRKFAIVERRSTEKDITITKDANMLEVLNAYTYHYTNEQRMNSTNAYRIQRSLVRALMEEASGSDSRTSGIHG